MFAYCLDMPGTTEEMASRVDEGVGSEPVVGLIAHVSGPYGAGWRIIDVWESQEHEERFTAQRLGPAVARAAAGMATPPVPFERHAVTGAAMLSRLG